MRQGGRAVLWLLGAGLLGYLTLIAALFVFQRALMYFPTRGAIVPAEYGLTDFRTVTVRTRDGLLIDGWYKPALYPDKPTVALFHGNAGHIGHRADKALDLAAAGYGVFLVGYRGYGGNEGQPTEPGLYADARAALDWLVEQGVSGRRLVLYGESLGTGVAVRMAGERRVGGVVLEAPYTAIVDVAAALYPWVPVRRLMHDRFDSLSRIADIQAPLLVIHGERDRVVPVTYGKRLFAAAKEPKTAIWLPDAGHNDLREHGLMAHVVDWLSDPTRRPAITLDQPKTPGTALVPRSGP